MKSYFLAPITSKEKAVKALTSLLPTEADGWLLKDPSGDVMAYFSMVECDSETGVRTVQVDVSGRHYNCDAEVIAVLKQVQQVIGGEITNDA